MIDLRFALILLALACNPQPGTPGGVEPAEATVASWAERFELVRSDLVQLEAAHGAKDQDAAVASWEQAYRQRFEILIEQPVGADVDVHQIMAVEYAFGRVREGLESPRPAPVLAALTHLREQLDALEPAVAALPAPIR